MSRRLIALVLALVAAVVISATAFAVTSYSTAGNGNWSGRHGGSLQAGNGSWGGRHGSVQFD
jgi:uncharacterized membrane protein YgcG